MLRSLKELLGYELLASDGQIGKVDDFLFSDEEWTIRYMIADTGPWILGRRVLISVMTLGQPIWESKVFPVELSREEVKSSPDADLAQPVSRQYEEELQLHYRWPAYWAMTNAVPGRMAMIPQHLFSEKRSKTEQRTEMTHLRSAEELIGYQMNGTDGEAGTLHDFIVDDENWQIQYMVAKLNKQLEADKEVLMALDWLEHISIARQSILTALPREMIKNSPAFDPNVPVNRQYEEVLYDYHGRPKYWQIVEHN